MKLREIPDYLSKKVRRERWSPDYFITFDGFLWRNPRGDNYAIASGDSQANDWTVYEEPRKKRSVTLWAPIYLEVSGVYSLGAYTSNRKEHEYTRGHHSITVEVDE